VVAVADHGSFRAAATSVQVTQPALSALIAQLERDLGVQLFERDRRRVMITPAGEAIVAAARRTLEALDDLVEVAGGARQPLTGTVRLGVIPTVAPYLLPAVVSGLRTRFPSLRLVLREDQTARVLGELDAGRLDAVIVATPVPGDVAVAEMYREEFLFAAASGHPLLHRKKLREADLEGETALLLEDGHCLRDQALAVCRAAGAPEATEVRATSLPTLVPMVAGGLGVTLLPEMAASSLAPRKGGVGVAPFAEHPGRTIVLAWRMSSARAREFRMLADAISESAAAHLKRLRS
jgi:LysR family hydrogen peroxide-inducible transcriptional activator